MRRKPALVGRLVRPLHADRQQVAYIRREVRVRGLRPTDTEALHKLADESAYVARWLPGEVGVITRRYARGDKYDVAVVFGAQCEWPRREADPFFDSFAGTPGDGFVREYLFVRDELEVL